jgi:hypothetical protein
LQRLATSFFSFSRWLMQQSYSAHVRCCSAVIDNSGFEIISCCRQWAMVRVQGLDRLINNHRAQVIPCNTIPTKSKKGSPFHLIRLPYVIAHLESCKGVFLLAPALNSNPEKSWIKCPGRELGLI